MNPSSRYSGLCVSSQNYYSSNNDVYTQNTYTFRSDRINPTRYISGTGFDSFSSFNSQSSPIQSFQQALQAYQNPSQSYESAQNNYQLAIQAYTSSYPSSSPPTAAPSFFGTSTPASSFYGTSTPAPSFFNTPTRQPSNSYDWSAFII